MNAWKYQQMLQKQQLAQSDPGLDARKAELEAQIQEHLKFMKRHPDVYGHLFQRRKESEAFHVDILKAKEAGRVPDPLWSIATLRGIYINEEGRIIKKL